MRRFYLEELTGREKEAELTGEEFIHLKRVLRLGPGDEAALFNGKGVELTARIESVGARSARLLITGRNEAIKESPFGLTLIQGLLKGDKNEFIVQKATELGVSAICFFATSRTVSRVDEENAGKKLARWKKASVEAAKQCGRTVLPEIAFAEDLSSAVEGVNSGLKIILWEKEGTPPLKELLSSGKPGGAAVVIGPEGGLSDEDAGRAERAGFIKAGMGPRILRAETAAIAVAASIQFTFGDLGQAIDAPVSAPPR